MLNNVTILHNLQEWQKSNANLYSPGDIKNSIFKHQQLIGTANRQSTTRATFPNNNRNNWDLQTKHSPQIVSNGFTLYIGKMGNLAKLVLKENHVRLLIQFPHTWPSSSDLRSANAPGVSMNVTMGNPW